MLWQVQNWEANTSLNTLKDAINCFKMGLSMKAEWITQSRVILGDPGSLPVTTFTYMVPEIPSLLVNS